MKIPGAVFDPEDVEVLQQALDTANDAIPNEFKRSDLKTRMAERILTAASRGQRDPDRLADSALAQFTDYVSAKLPEQKPAADSDT
jgi:hypothetical protein